MDPTEAGLRCPHCSSSLVSFAAPDGDEGFRCDGCRAEYPVGLGIPDLRIFDDPYIDRRADREKGRRLAEAAVGRGFADLLAFYYDITPAVPPGQAEQFTRGLLGAEARSRAAIDRWENRTSPEGREKLLSVGCGTGPALVAASSDFDVLHGIDIAFRWLVVGTKRLEERDVEADLCCGCAEALPYPSDCYNAVIAESAMEHFRDRQRAMAEIYRVLRPGGVIWMTTPNRWSLGPDPHTGLPAGGYLPERFSSWWVERKGGVPPQRELLSAPACRDLLTGAGFRDVRVFLPVVPPGQRRKFGPVVRLLARAYERLRRFPPARSLLLGVGPSLMASGRKLAGSDRPSSN